MEKKRGKEKEREGGRFYGTGSRISEDWQLQIQNPESGYLSKS